MSPARRLGRGLLLCAACLVKATRNEDDKKLKRPLLHILDTNYVAWYRTKKMKRKDKIIAESNNMVNDYQVCEKVGEGSYGAVYKVVHLLTSKVYAMKVGFSLVSHFFLCSAIVRTPGIEPAMELLSM